ncbi:MAG: MBG domain-containing protein [Gammaproteobacteria bacterium]|nr:MBG domain-containing protein [Gammaproteobacteria bacterium]
MTIDPATLSLDLNDQSRRYGSANPEFTYDLSGFVLGEDASVLSALEVTTTAGADAAVGDYGITANAAAANYVVDVMEGVLSVTPAPLQISVDDAARTYGSDNPDFTYVCEGFVLGEDASVLAGFSIDTSATAASNVGDYALRGAGSSSNYDISFADGTLVIEPATLAVQVHDQSRTYGMDNPDLTFSADGFVLGQDVSDLSAFSIQTSATVSSDVGDYAITASASASNYVLSVENGMLTIDPARVLIELHDQRRLYGSENPELTYSASGFVLGDDLADLDGVSVTTAATAASGVGNYAIRGAVGGEQSGNYVVDIVDALLTVDPAPLQISVEDAVRAFGSGELSYFATVSGFVNGEDIGVLEGALSVTDTTALFAPSGMYRDALMPSGVSAANYTIDFSAGDLTITPVAVDGIDIAGTDEGELFEGQNRVVFKASHNREIGSQIRPLFPYNSIEPRDARGMGAFSYRTNPFFDLDAGGESRDERKKRVWVHATTFGAR